MRTPAVLAVLVVVLTCSVAGLCVDASDNSVAALSTHASAAASPPVTSIAGKEQLPPLPRMETSPRSSTSPATCPENDDGYLSYSLPPDAKRRRVCGSKVGWDAAVYERGDEVIGLEHIYRESGHKMMLELYRSGKLHGVKKEWYDNGVQKSSIPYYNGLMHGWVKSWDDKGNLLGCSLMKNGTGVIRIYHADGKLDEETPYKDNLRDGLALGFDRGGQLSYWQGWEKDKCAGDCFSFWYGFTVWCAVDREGRRNSPMLRVDKDGKHFTELSFDIHGQHADRETYVKESQKDPTLPKFVDDPSYYLAKGANAKAWAEKYASVASVRMPIGEDGTTQPANSDGTTTTSVPSIPRNK